MNGVNEWELQCTPVSAMAGLVSYCSDVLFNSTLDEYYVSSHADPIVQDSLARQSGETVLNMATSCRLVVISDQCVRSYQEYACASNFLFCSNDTMNGSPALLQPCRSMCFQYCEDCMLEVCPCSHLPETHCYTHEAGLTGNSTDVNGASSTALSTTTWVSTALAVFALQGRRR